MRRLPVSYRAEALDDLRDIFRMILLASRSVPTARGFVQRIKDRCERIGDAPHGGRPRDDLETGLRTVPFEHTAVIAYRAEPTSVRITNVFYGGRDFEALYRGASSEDEA
ncbi:type II toxin-antitoxin system RelE/ParE family toxin [Methylobacterium sp. WL12]|uniref:type II toxin-antitoxin system RelE/ParE family toxin n=1 Tax=unclassified Methylobacterium TaxID=2615210 RepID=UPI0011C907F2|nr:MULTISPECIES: type II toxin-antitoxin system RelE/ParE family toxin [unclassified Methylobacterium]TXM66533.1 type II toxin-antitoxin system RelE/ParE family toxin [Methylobacterium sp. WL120]TXM68248.1 type II toxin-antitoxin system RelE/ParE family toxin [Methylobacterium sp. WL12]